VLGQGYQGNFAWHYPPPFLFVASCWRIFPTAVAFIGWGGGQPQCPISPSLRGIVAGRSAFAGRWRFRWLLTKHAGRAEWFLTALADRRHALSDAGAAGTVRIFSGCSATNRNTDCCSLVLIAASQWTVFFTAGAVAVAMALASWLAFGTESWQAFFSLDADVFTGLPPPRAARPWGKMQSIFRGGAVFRRHRAARLAVPMDHERHRRRSVLTLMWRKPHQLPVEGQPHSRADITDHAIPVSLRPDVLAIAMGSWSGSD